MLSAGAALVSRAVRVGDSSVRFRQAQPARLEALVGFFLFLGRNNGLTCVAALADPRPGDELRAAPAAFFRHRLLQREDARLLGQQMGIVEIAMIHVSNLAYSPFRAGFPTGTEWSARGDSGYFQSRQARQGTQTRRRIGILVADPKPLDHHTVPARRTSGCGRRRGRCEELS